MVRFSCRFQPDALSFFNGKRFVPFVVILRSAIVAIVLSFVWPVIKLESITGIWIADSQDTPVLRHSCMLLWNSLASIWIYIC